MRRFLFFLIVASFGISQSCKKEDLSLKCISLSASELTMTVDEALQLVVVASPSSSMLPELSWNSSNANVVVVDNNGVIKGVSAGDAVVKVSTFDKSLSSSCKVTVKPIKASGLTLDASEISLLVDGSHQFVVTQIPSKSEVLNYVWASGNKDVVTVDEGGLVKAKSVGEAIITVSNTEKTLSAICKVVVLPINAAAIELNVNKMTVNIGGVFFLTYKITPENTTNKQVVWTSDNEGVAAVNGLGKVTAIGVGVARVKAKTSNNIESVCEVLVNPVKATGMALSDSSLILEMGDKRVIKAVFVPDTTTNKNVKWSSSNESIAVVTSAGEVLGLREGSAIITAISEDGGFTAGCTVNVKMKGIVLTKSKLEALPNHEELVWVKYLLSDLAYTKASWKSSNPEVADVVGDGVGTNSAVIKTKNIGTAVISAIAEDGTNVASCEVVVKGIKDFISLAVISQGIVNINGFIYGDVYSQIKNNSTQPIVLTSFAIYDGNSGVLVGFSNDPAKLGALLPNSSANLGKKLNSTYYPIFKWIFTWNGNTYEVQHQFSKSVFGWQKEGDVLNIIN